jgi:release factor glutamine methyltransferase
VSSSASLLADAARRLAAAGLDSPRLEAELLLEAVTGVPRLRRGIRDPGLPDGDSLRQFEEWLQQRCRRVPFQHLTGTAPFLDFDLRVTSDVLIPRPETECLALCARRLVPSGGGRVIDLGTGSGCLALALALARTDLEIHAVDVSAAALLVARGNAGRLGLLDRVRFHQADVFGEHPFPTQWGRFDLVMTNPPYIPRQDIAMLQPEVRDHDPHLALDGGVDGLDPYRQLARRGLSLLNDTGWLLAEFGDGQGDALTGIFARHGWTDISLEKDLSGRDRILIVRPPRSNQSSTPRCGPTDASSPWTAS